MENYYNPAHLISLDGDGDSEENAGGQTKVAKAFCQVVLVLISSNIVLIVLMSK